MKHIGFLFDVAAGYVLISISLYLNSNWLDECDQLEWPQFLRERKRERESQSWAKVT